MTSCRRGGGGVPFSMTRHDMGGRGGHEVHDIMLGEKLSKTNGKGTFVYIYNNPGILVKGLGSPPIKIFEKVASQSGNLILLFHMNKKLKNY